jgi:hypothetical protein
MKNPLPHSFSPPFCLPKNVRGWPKKGTGRKMSADFFNSVPAGASDRLGEFKVCPLPLGGGTQWLEFCTPKKVDLSMRARGSPVVLILGKCSIFGCQYLGKEERAGEVVGHRSPWRWLNPCLERGFFPMPDLTLLDLRGLSEEELRRRLREEALKLLGPGGHERPTPGDLCPVLRRHFLSVKRAFLEKLLSEAREARRKDRSKTLRSRRPCGTPGASSE